MAYKDADRQRQANKERKGVTHRPERLTPDSTYDIGPQPLMPFKAKLRKIGNSVGVILPKDVITCYNVGDEIELNVITTTPEGHDVITEDNDFLEQPSPLTTVDSFATTDTVTPEQLCHYCGLPTDQPSPQCSRH